MWIVPTVLLVNLMIIYLSFRNLPISRAVRSEAITASTVSKSPESPDGEKAT